MTSPSLASDAVGSSIPIRILPEDSIFKGLSDSADFEDANVFSGEVILQQGHLLTQLVDGHELGGSASSCTARLMVKTPYD
jgi:hypothetical protein